MPRVWDMPEDVRTVHLCSCTPVHAAEIGELLDEVGITWWEKPPNSGFLAFLERDSQVFVDRERLDEARSIARRVLQEA